MRQQNFSYQITTIVTGSTVRSQIKDRDQYFETCSIEERILEQKYISFNLIYRQFQKSPKVYDTKTLWWEQIRCQQRTDLSVLEGLNKSKNRKGCNKRWVLCFTGKIFTFSLVHYGRPGLNGNSWSRNSSGSSMTYQVKNE